MKKINYIILLLGVVLFSCKDPYADDVFVAQEDLPAAAYLNEDPNFSMWVDLLHYANMYKTLNLNYASTYFVPTNAAVSKYLADNGLSSVRSMDVSSARTLASYHVLPFVVREQSSFVQGLISDTTGTGDFLNVSFQEGGIRNIIINNEAKLLSVDVEVTNGVIHTMDGVLTPITESVWVKVNTDANSIFVDALEACGLDDTLDVISKTVIVEGLPRTQKMRYTLFAVSNSVYNEAGITDLASLTSYLGVSDTDYESEDNGLNRYLRYHILEGTYSYAQLNDFGLTETGVAATSKNVATYCENGIVNFSGVGDQFFINYNSSTLEGISITEMNNNCKNGMIQQVNNVMIIESPAPVTYKFDFAAYPEIGQLYPDLWQTVTRTTNGGPSNVSMLNCYKLNTVPANLSTPLQYYITNKGGTNPVATLANALFLDVLYVTLGAFGTVDMTIPPIVPGRYKLSLAYHNQASGTAPLQFYIDDVLIGTMATRGKDGATQYVVAPFATELEFTTTTSHLLRIVATTNEQSQLDYLMFEPVI